MSESRDQLLEQLRSLESRLRQLDATEGSEREQHHSASRLEGWPTEVFRHGPDAVLLIDVESDGNLVGKIRMANLMAEQMYGFDPGKMSDVSVNSLLAQNRTPKWLRPNSSSGAIYEDEHVHTNGSRFPVELSLSRATVGDVECAIVFVREITHRKIIENELRECEQRFRAIFNSTFQFIGLLDVRGNLLEANETALAFGGLQSADVLHRPFWEAAWWSDDAERVKQLRESVIRAANGEFVRYNVDVQGVDRVETIDFSLTPVFNQKGEVHVIVPEGRLVTDWMRAEAELEETRAILSAAIEASPAGIIIADAPDVRIRSVNSAALGIRDAPINDLTDIPYELHPTRWQCTYADGTEYRPEDLPLSRAVLNGEVSRNVDVIIERADGVKQWVLGNAAPVRSADGEVVAGVVVFPDVTEQKRGEESLRKMESELAHVARVSTMGEMVGGLAHELNQPLYAIQNFGKACENLVGDGQEFDVALLQQWLGKIVETAEYAGEVLSRLRQFVTREPMKRDAVELLGIIDTAVALTRHDSQLRGVRVEQSIPDHLPNVDVDSVQIQQVLVNLIRNALDAIQTESCGDPHIVIKAKARDEIVEVSVTDTGPGLPPNLKIFEAFNSTKPNGMGLGLAIGRTIIEAHGGTLVAGNVPGGGAEFRFSLPFSR